MAKKKNSKKKVISVLVVSSKFDYETQSIKSGVDYHRLFAPFHLMEKDYSEYAFTICKSPFHIPLKELKKFDFCVFNLMMGYANDKELNGHPKGAFGSKKIIQYLQDLNITVIMDIDDTWKVDAKHHYNRVLEQRGLNNISVRTHIIDGLMNADLVTTTNHLLKKDIQGLSHVIDVEVVPNGINGDLPMFNADKKLSKDYVTFGFAKTTFSNDDLEILRSFLPWAYDNEKFRLIFMGISDHSESHRAAHRFLSMNEKASRKQYGFIPRMDPGQYAYAYDEIDVLLTPLADTHFNRCKSNLKQIECLYTKTLFLGSNVGPYKDTPLGFKFNDLNELKELTSEIINDITELRRLADGNRRNKELISEYSLAEANKKRHEIFQSFD